MVKVKVKEIPKSKVNPDELNFIDEHRNAISNRLP